MQTVRSIQRNCKREGGGYKIYWQAEYLLGQLTDIPKEQVGIKKVTVRDLGLPHGGNAKEILKAAEAHNLKPCPPWVGPQYRMECDDDEDTTIGMEPLTDSDGDACVFFVSRNSRGRWLHSGHADGHWRPDGGWLFVPRT